ncbi:MAG TPA: hypothetical protein PKZ02_02255 [Candidatus Paceibacterota bacterium]|nr:hypothetical protein [Candidatus Paceibacterota bacterium]HRZ51528.1 hypothetical protein [Candidatus Paceibacterota bacterium]HSA37247.1 hypothetical protein [Candidatus Paceibacterota bacterium]
MNEPNKKTLKDRLRDFFVPDFSRAYLYLLSLTLLVFLLFNDNFTIVFGFLAMYWPLLIIIEICGILAIYSAFTDRPMGNTLKGMMLSYVIFFNIVIAVASFFSVFSFADFFQDSLPASRLNLSLIFPAVNVLDAFLLFFLFKGNVLTEKSIKDDKIGIVDLIAGSVAIALIYIVGIQYLKLGWPIVFSMCVFYSGHISKTFSGLFYGNPVLLDSIVKKEEMKLILAAVIILFMVGTGRSFFFLAAFKMAQKDIGWCALMPNQFMLDACYSKNKALIDDPALCENIDDSFTRDYCVWDVAARLNDPVICGQMSFEGARYLCQQKFGFIGSFCYSDDGCRNNAKCVNDVCR